MEHHSNGSSSQMDWEYHSEQEAELEEEQNILIDYSQGHMFLNIQFPLPAQFPKPYLSLQEVISNHDDALPKPYVWTHDSIKDPKSALSYIITNFNIRKVSKSIQDFPLSHYNQVYYSTYINTSWYTTLQHYIATQAYNLWVQNALVQKQLEIQIRYARYQTFDDLPPYLLQCFL